MIVNPVFTNSKERNDIVSRDDVSYMQEIPNSEKNYVVQAKTSLTESGFNAQATNLNTYNVGQFRVRGVREFTFSGYTYKPTFVNSGGVGSYGTGPMLWNPLNSTVDSFCINKSIQELKFNIAGKQFTSVDRENPEMIDIYATQFNIDVLKSWGLAGDHGIKGASELVHGLPLAHGSDVFGFVDIGTMGYPATITFPFLPNNQISEKLKCSTPWIRNNNGYCRYTVSYKQGASLTTATDLFVNTELPQYTGLPIPVTASGGSTIFYSADAISGTPADLTTPVKLWQIVQLEIMEDLIDPNLSNSYSKNQNKKIYYNGSNSLNIEFKFNKEYLDNSFLQWTPGQRIMNGLAITDPEKYVPKLVSAVWKDMDIRFWTFNSSSPIPTNPMKIFYYKELRQTPQLMTIAKGSTREDSKSEGQINTALQSNMPPFIVIYGACRKSQNSTYHASPLYSGNVEMFDIEKLTLQVGTQADCLGNIEVYRDELVQHTLDVLGNPEYRQMLRSELSLVAYGDFGVNTGFDVDGATTYDQIGQILATTPDLSPALLRNLGWNFYILDMARLNLRSTNGVPIVPLVNFGAQNAKAISVKPTFRFTEQMQRYSSGNLTCEYNLVLMRPFIRTLPIGNGSLTDDEVVFNQGEVAGSLMEKINSDYGNTGSHQISYMGGAFLGNISNKAMEVLRNPVVKGLITSAVSAMGQSDPFPIGSGVSLEQRLRNKYGRA